MFVYSLAKALMTSLLLPFERFASRVVAAVCVFYIKVGPHRSGLKMTGNI